MLIGVCRFCISQRRWIDHHDWYKRLFYKGIQAGREFELSSHLRKISRWAHRSPLASRTIEKTCTNTKNQINSSKTPVRTSYIVHLPADRQAVIVHAIYPCHTSDTGPFLNSLQTQ